LKCAISSTLGLLEEYAIAAHANINSTYPSIHRDLFISIHLHALRNTPPTNIRARSLPLIEAQPIQQLSQLLVCQIIE
jgi:hypothetical protein